MTVSGCSAIDKAEVLPPGAAPVLHNRECRARVIRPARTNWRHANSENRPPLVPPPATPYARTAETDALAVGRRASADCAHGEQRVSCRQPGPALPSSWRGCLASARTLVGK